MLRSRALLCRGPVAARLLCAAAPTWRITRPRTSAAPHSAWTRGLHSCRVRATSSSDVSPDDIEEPDLSRQDAVHAHAPAAGAPLQCLTAEAAEAIALAPPFTPQELERLIADLRAFREVTAFADPPTTTTEPPPLTPSPSSPAAAAAAASTTTAAASSTPLPQSSTAPMRPFLASWSVKEVCSWYLQVEEQLHLPTPPGPTGQAPPSNHTSSPIAMSFVALLQKHAIDGARLLAFTSQPLLIPLISPQLLSRILYLRQLDTYSPMFQPPPGVDDHAHSADPNMRHLQGILASTVKIFCTSTSPDFARPWAQLDQVDSTSSGFVISDRRILGNAHGVTAATNIRVRKHGDPRRYKATISVISHEADLVLLEVESDKFWEGLEPLQFGTVPRLQDTVIVVGYPTGGDSICVTKGVVSRILVSRYVHSEESLLTVQIDAAINSGNSGGPVLLNGAVVGVAFQGVSDAQSVGFIIPVPVVHHFLNDIRLHAGRYTGFPSFGGLMLQKMECPSLKQFFGLDDEETGVVVMSVAQLDPAHAVLRRRDVVTHIDGIPVADDGSIFFRSGERISARYLPSSKFVGDTVTLRVIRDRQPMEVTFPLQARQALVPTHLYDQQPSYFICAGLVFTPLTRPYLVDTFGKAWQKRAPVDLIQLTYYGEKADHDQQVVLLSTILVHDVNAGYGPAFHNLQLVAVNEQRVRNLRHLVQIVEAEKAAGAPFLRFDFTLNRLVVLETNAAFASLDQILDENNIEHDRSEDLRPQEQEEEEDEEQEPLLEDQATTSLAAAPDNQAPAAAARSHTHTPTALAAGMRPATLSRTSASPLAAPRATSAPAHSRSFATIPTYAWGAPTRLSVGDTCSMTKSFSAADVAQFGEASGDWNPVHFPDRHAALVASGTAKWRADPATASLPLPKTGIFRFGAPIVHGMLTASIIGTLFATRLPGAIYMQQALHFRAPVFYDELVTARIEVLAVSRQRVTCRTTVEKAGPDGQPVLVVEGEAKVMLETLARIP